MVSVGAEMEEKEERRRLEGSVLEACTRSLEGADLLVSAFVQALRSYRRSSVNFAPCTVMVIESFYLHDRSRLPDELEKLLPSVVLPSELFNGTPLSQVTCLNVCTPFPTPLFTAVDDFKEKDFTAAAVAIQSFPPLRNIVSTWPRDKQLSTSGSGRTCTGEGPVPDHGAGDSSAGIFYSGNRPGSKQDGHEGLTNDSSEGSSCSSTSISAQKMSIRALKLLHWILRFRHHVEFVQDPAHELLGLLPLDSPRVLFRDVPLEGSGMPHYVLKIQDMEEIENVNCISVFHTVKAQYGSIFAFHGTSAENLHSILRCGLLNMSRTQLQRNGAIFGEGVYLSTDPAVAHGFCKAEDGWEHSFLGPRVRYLLLCEVAKGEGVSLNDENVASSSDSRSSPEGASALHSRLEKPAAANGMPQTYIVVQNSDLVKIRFVFVYNEPSQRKCVGLLLGQQNMVAEVSTRPGSSPAGSTHKLGLPDYFKRIDWCKTFMVLYIALMVGVGLMKSNAVKFGRGSFALHVWPFYQ